MIINDSKLEIDHINHNPTDNRKCNLRITSRSVNCYNRRILRTNTSGVTGVYVSKDGKYHAQITIDKKKYYLGTFNTLEDAKNTRYKVEKQYIHKTLSAISNEVPNRETLNDYS